jgi:hypothetical protein
MKQNNNPQKKTVQKITITMITTTTTRQRVRVDA